MIVEKGVGKRAAHPSARGSDKGGPTVGMLSLGGMALVDPWTNTDAATAGSLRKWQARPDPAAGDPECFHAADVSCLWLDAALYPLGYFPDKVDNLLSETISRLFLDDMMVQRLARSDPFLLRASYRVIAIEDVHHLLVCPYTKGAGGDFGGVVVVDLERRLTAREPVA